MLSPNVRHCACAACPHPPAAAGRMPARAQPESAALIAPSAATMVAAAGGQAAVPAEQRRRRRRQAQPAQAFGQLVLRARYQPDSAALLCWAAIGLSARQRLVRPPASSRRKSGLLLCQCRFLSPVSPCRATASPQAPPRPESPHGRPAPAPLLERMRPRAWPWALRAVQRGISAASASWLPPLPLPPGGHVGVLGCVVSTICPPLHNVRGATCPLLHDSSRVRRIQALIRPAAPQHAQGSRCTAPPTSPGWPARSVEIMLLASGMLAAHAVHVLLPPIIHPIHPGSLVLAVPGERALQCVAACLRRLEKWCGSR